MCSIAAFECKEVVGKIWGKRSLQWSMSARDVRRLLLHVDLYFSPVSVKFVKRRAEVEWSTLPDESCTKEALEIIMKMSKAVILLLCTIEHVDFKLIDFLSQIDVLRDCMQCHEMQTSFRQLEMMKLRREDNEGKLGSGRSHKSPLLPMHDHSFSFLVSLAHGDLPILLLQLMHTIGE